MYFVVLYPVCAGLTDYLQRLDGRYHERAKMGGTIMAQKHRKIGALASSRPPADAPEWAVDAQWKQQQSMCVLSCTTWSQ